VGKFGLGAAATGMLTGLIGAIVLVLLCVLITILFISLVHAVTARLKIEQVFKYYWTVVTGLAALSLVLAWFKL
jgi:NADH-quinone oxidoreductase subunit H